VNDLDAGTAQLNELIKRLPLSEVRRDIDTESLQRRFPHLEPVDVAPITIDGDSAAIPARLYRGASHSGRGFVWVHGGAFIAGDLDMPESHWVSMEIASRGIPVLALDYRKAIGGVHHPALSNDVLAGWLASSDLLELPVEQLTLGGASAGANLSAGVAARLVDSRDVRPASLVLVYPVLHPVLPQAGHEAARAAAGLPADARFSPEFVRAINVNYAGGPQNLDDEIAFPANGDLTNMPITLIVNAEGDDLRASGEAFGRQLGDAGVAVEVEFEPGTAHGYLDLPGEDTAISTIDRIVAWMTERE